MFSRCVAEGQHANGCQCVDIECRIRNQRDMGIVADIVGGGVCVADDAQQLELYRQCTGRATPPSAPFSEVYLCCGRRAGKSFALALIATFLATFRDYRPHLQPGERATRQFTIDDKFSPLNW